MNTGVVRDVETDDDGTDETGFVEGVEAERDARACARCAQKFGFEGGALCSGGEVGAATSLTIDGVVEGAVVFPFRLDGDDVPVFTGGGTALCDFVLELSSLGGVLAPVGGISMVEDDGVVDVDDDEMVDGVAGGGGCCWTRLAFARSAYETGIDSRRQ